MRKFYLSLLLAFGAFLFSANNSNAQVGIGFIGGLSTPSDEINNIYNSDNLGSVGKFVRDGAKTGYHFGVKIRMPLVSGIMLTGGAAWHRFPESTIDVNDPTTGSKLITLSTVQDIIPITAGINYYIINTGVGLYGTGELSYNYNKNTVNVDYNGTSIPANFDTAPTYNRVGAGFGAGIDFNAFLFLANLEAKYNYANIIGRDSGEELKAYFTLSLGIHFGTASAR